MSISSEQKNCPKCGAPIPAEAPQGLCPKCLLQEISIPTEAGAENRAKPAPPLLAELSAAFPQLEIIELIGQGGMGFVFKARQPKLDRFVALKILPQSLAADPAFAERFTREGRLLARLNHPNIVAVHDFGQAKEFFYLLMEYVDGVNLRQAMRAGRFTPEQAIGIVPKICEALQFAHNEGILHRDIKPENILLDTKGRVKIADFGIAKLISEANAETKSEIVSDPALTNAGKTLGTPNYMAPEQIEKPNAVDHRADIYSLGVVFYEMLTGELPRGQFAPPSQKSAADPRLDDVVLRALEKEPNRRTQSAGEVKTQVETIATTPTSHSERESAPTATLLSIDEKSSWWFCSPLASLEMREIVAHLTPKEKRRLRTIGAMFGIWNAATWFAPVCIYFWFPPIHSWKLPLIVWLTGVVFYPAWIKMQVELICSTGWARARGINPATIRKFSFSRKNILAAVVLIVVITLAAFGVQKAFLRLSGNAELTASLKEGAARRKNFSTGFLRQTKSDYIGQTYFPHGDSIEITSVERFEDEMIVRGHYKLVSETSADLTLNITSKNEQPDRPGPEKSMHISQGEGDFELSRSNLVPGMPHVSMYANGKSFAGIYFGTKEEALEEGRLVLNKENKINSEQVLAEYDWETLLRQGQVERQSYFSMKIEEPHVLRIKNTDGTDHKIRLLTIVKPPIASTRYAIEGEVKLENVQSNSWLEMWNHFPPASLHDSESVFLSSSFSHTTNWQRFNLGFDRSTIGDAPTFLEVNLVLPANGVAYLRSTKLIQSRGVREERTATSDYSIADSLPPVVIETSPVSGIRNAEPGEAEIRVRFSKEMSDKSWSWGTAWENSMPEIIEGPRFNSGHRTCVIKVKLEPERTYACWLNSEMLQNFKDKSGNPAVPYLLIFKTTK